MAEPASRGGPARPRWAGRGAVLVTIVVVAAITVTALVAARRSSGDRRAASTTAGDTAPGPPTLPGAAGATPTTRRAATTSTAAGSPGATGATGSTGSTGSTGVPGSPGVTSGGPTGNGTARPSNPRPTPTTTTPATAPGTPSDAALDNAYVNAYRGECRWIWSHAADGRLYDPDDLPTSYTVQDCYDQLDVSVRTADTIAVARTDGKNDAIDNASFLSSTTLLCWIDQASQSFVGCWDSSDPATTVAPPS